MSSCIPRPVFLLPPDVAPRTSFGSHDFGRSATAEFLDDDLPGGVLGINLYLFELRHT